MRSQRPFQFDVLRSLSCLAHSKHLPPSHPPLFLSIYLLFSLSCRFASLHGLMRSACPSFSLPRIFLSVRPSLFLFFLRVPFAKLRSIFHLELRRSLAINPRIHYGLRGPYCSFFATSARCLLCSPPVCQPSYLPAYLPACLPACLLACAGHRLRFALQDHLDDPDASSFGYATTFPVIGPTQVFASTAVIRSCVAIFSARIARTSPRSHELNICTCFYNTH